MITREQFHAECSKIQQPEDIKFINDQRKKKNIKIIIYLSIISFIFVLLIINTHHFIRFFIMFFLIMLAFVGVGIISTSFVYKINKKMKTKYANQVLEILFKGYNFKFSHQKHIEESIFKNSPLSAYYETFSAEDLIAVNIPNDDGTPSEVILKACDIKTTKTESYTDSSGDRKTRTVTVYSGMFGFIKFPFIFKCNIGINCRKDGLKYIELEDDNFNKIFSIYTDNQLESLVVLTPSLMVKLIEFSKRNKSLKYYLAKNGEFYFGMNRNLFEIHLSKKNTAFSNIFDRFYDDVKSIIDIIDEIKNNNKIFKM